MLRGLLTFLGTGSDRLPGPRPTFFSAQIAIPSGMAIAQIPEGVRFAAATASNLPGQRAGVPASASSVRV